MTYHINVKVIEQFLVEATTVLEENNKQWNNYGTKTNSLMLKNFEKRADLLGRQDLAKYTIQDSNELVMENSETTLLQVQPGRTYKKKLLEDKTSEERFQMPQL
ncbi:hypothetical protein SNEBB_000971 [Seison nebaliae]|nr:hypothetical protein SNEBB_000971 [Seison nebaliae]